MDYQHAANQAADTSGAVQNALTFQPKTANGETGAEKLGAVMGSPLNPLNYGKDLNQYFGISDKLAENGYPGAATAVDVGLDAASGAGVGKIASVGAKAALASREAALSAAAAPTINTLKDQSRALYKEIDNSGVVIPKEQVQNLVGDLYSTVKDEGFNKKMHPAVQATLKEFRTASEADQPISNIDTLRKVANNAAGSMDKSEARLGKIMVGKIDGFMDNLDGKTFSGLSEPGAAENIGAKYKDARQLWQRASKAEVIDRAMQKAKNQASGFENGIRTQFRSILNSDKKSRMFNPEETAAMEHVIQGGSMENLAKYIGRLGFGEGQASNMMLGTLGAGAGAAIAGAPGAIAVPLIGQASRSLAQKMTRNNAAMVSQLVRSGKDSTAITRAYLANTPIKERSAADLSELLLKMGAKDEIKIKPKDKSLSSILTDTKYLMGLSATANQGENQ
jgi:hypothetical protein